MSTSPEQTPHEAALFRTIREWGITRGDHGVVGGVVEGLGDRIGMARVPARIITVVAAVPLFGLVLLAYAAGWALLPDRQGNIIVQNFGRGIPNVGALIGIGILTLFGLGGFDRGSSVSLNGFPWGNGSDWGAGQVIAVIFAVLVPLLIIGGVITLVVVLVKRGNAAGPGAPVGPGTPTFAAPPATTAPSTPDAGTSSAGPEAGAEATGASAPTPSSAPAGMPASAQGPAYAAVPPTAYAMPPAMHYAPVPLAPPRPPRVPGPGRTFYLMSLALVAISIAAAAWLDRDDRLAVHPSIAAFVIFVTGLGVIAMLVSLAGRKLGFLGFVAISSLLPLFVIAAQADDLRIAYQENGGITRNGSFSISIDPPPTATATDDNLDPTLVFAGLYSNAYFNGYCWTSDWDDYGATSVQRIDLSGIAGTATADTDVDITAEVTYLSIARGTSITLEGEMNAQAVVVFADRDLRCDMSADGGSYLELTNPDSPTINLKVSDDMYANTIVITEVAS